MSEGTKALPTIIATSVVRGSQQGESHGGVYLVDFERQDARIMVDWNDSGIDFTGRGWDRGLRGLNSAVMKYSLRPVMNCSFTIKPLASKGHTKTLF